MKKKIQSGTKSGKSAANSGEIFKPASRAELVEYLSEDAFRFAYAEGAVGHIEDVPPLARALWSQIDTVANITNRFTIEGYKAEQVMDEMKAATDKITDLAEQARVLLIKNLAKYRIAEKTAKKIRAKAA